MRRPGALVLLSLCALLFAVPAAGATPVSPGQPVGSVYTSDIRAYVDGMPIDSYNIGGRAVVVCENLVQYGFQVSWNGQARVLSVKTGPMPPSPPAWSGRRSQPGTVAGTVFTSNIVTYVNGRAVTSYNIGGRTAVALEDLGQSDMASRLPDGPAFSEYGFSCAWDPVSRTISLSSLRPGSRITCDVGQCTVTDLILTGQLGYSLERRPLRLDGTAISRGVITATLPVGNRFIPLAETLNALGAGWRWSSDDDTLYIDDAVLSPPQPAPSEEISGIQNRIWNVPGVRVSMSVNGRSIQVPRDASRYVPADAIVCDNRLYVRCEALAAALDLMYVPDDGFYRKTDSPVCWDHTFIPYMGGEDEWLLSATPSFFSASGGSLGIPTHRLTDPITVVFSRKMDGATLSPDTVAVFYRTTLENGRTEYKTISGLYEYAYDKGIGTLSLTPAGGIDVPLGAVITVAIKPSIADADGRHPSTGFKIGFVPAE